MTDWNTRYRQGEHIHDLPNPLVTDFAARLAAGRALDVACGTGRHALWLAEHGWRVTAVDSSSVAIEMVQRQASDRGLEIDAILADLERPEFEIEEETYDLIVVCNYLQRDLFPSIQAGVRKGGIVIAIIAMVDDDPNIRPMNTAYLLTAGELAEYFEGWELLRNFEGKAAGEKHRRATAEIVARRLK